jgi:hypothetical protein
MPVGAIGLTMVGAIALTMVGAIVLTAVGAIGLTLVGAILIIVGAIGLTVVGAILIIVGAIVLGAPVRLRFASRCGRFHYAETGQCERAEVCLGVWDPGCVADIR